MKSLEQLLNEVEELHKPFSAGEEFLCEECSRVFKVTHADGEFDVGIPISHPCATIQILHPVKTSELVVETSKFIIP